ncbi:DUF2586 domain-containing protein [Marinomonas aquiplantarum]|uniref:Uncharacterized protein DUF2586 n=1 Tax=Marinomonas aquiplantarum TaxID=491951 RepID=A0A366D7I9_9GAMM|nr:DUF2586 domain-containing protein [Marinomonas aquiplantarum]RBO85915.1 uncharacterized protein DUF2586 [Marinomonas aquiplantarum]
MALGTVSVSSLDTGSGDFSTPERQFLFIGYAGKNSGSTLYIDQSSDLDEVLGVNNSKMKTAIAAARSNAGSNWTCVAMPRGAAGEWQTAFEEAMNNNVLCEAVVITDAVVEQAELDAMTAAAKDVENEYGRAVFFMAASEVMDGSATWATFISEFDSLQDGVAAENVMLVPEVFAGWLGTLCGRLCNEDVSIADTPMRVKTGALVGISSLPSDQDDVQFNMSHAKALNDARGTVPQVYPDYDGIYCSDGMTLAAEGSDYAVIENLRVVNRVKREVRLLAIKQVGNREMNSTPASIAANQTYFMRPMIDMSKSVVSNGIYMPGDVKRPEEGDVTISWSSRTSVTIALLVRPYNSPKAIQAYIGLNLSSEV